MAMPEAEYRGRISRVQELLREKDLEAAVVYYDELNIANGWYLSGWCPQFESGAVLVPAEGEAMILGGPESEPFARLDAAIRQTRNIPVFMVPEEEYPMAKISSFAEIFEEVFKGKEVRRIGVVGMNKIPYAIYSQIQKELAGIELVDITEAFEELRVIKSAWERRMIRKAFAIAEVGFKALMRAAKPGVTENFVAGKAEGAMRQAGANWFGFKTIVGSGRRSNGVVPTSTEKKLRKGETLLAGVSARYNGYNSANGMQLVVGAKPKGALKRYIQDAVEAFRLTREALRPGKSAQEIDSIPRNFLLERGYRDYMLVPYVHTIGLLEAEAPFFGPRSKDVLKPGMTVCIDISLFGHPKLYGVRVETGYEITEKGVRALCPWMERLILTTYR